MLSADEAAFIGFILEGISWGVYLVIFSLSLTFLVWRRTTKHINWRMLAATIVLFSLCTTHYVLEVENTITIFYNNPAGIPLADETNVLLGADTLLSITDFFANLVLIYRLWLVWSKNYYVIILPLLIACGSVACAMAAVGILATIDPNAPLAPPSVAKLGNAAFPMSLVLNILVTGLILGRMWFISRAPRVALSSQRTGPPRVYSAMAVVVESGLLFLIAQLVFVTLFALGNPAQDVVMPITLQIYGIAPTMIIVRVGMGVSSEPTSILTSSAHRLSHHSRKPPGMTISVTTDHIQAHDVDFEMQASPYKSPRSPNSASPRLPGYGSPTYTSTFAAPTYTSPTTNEDQGYTWTSNVAKAV